tara:strand:+ start:35 stop:220 length:186 start_codon:yes stop_codon:yes gene_type:complete
MMDDKDLEEFHNIGKHKLTIAWGQEQQETKTYTFDTAAEKTAFLKGVEAMDGWMKYEVISE